MFVSIPRSFRKVEVRAPRKTFHFSMAREWLQKEVKIYSTRGSIFYYCGHCKLISSLRYHLARVSGVNQNKQSFFHWRRVWTLFTRHLRISFTTSQIVLCSLLNFPMSESCSVVSKGKFHENRIYSNSVKIINKWTKRLFFLFFFFQLLQVLSNQIEEKKKRICAFIFIEK